MEDLIDTLVTVRSLLEVADSLANEGEHRAASSTYSRAAAVALAQLEDVREGAAA